MRYLDMTEQIDCTDRVLQLVGNANVSFLCLARISGGELEKRVWQIIVPERDYSVIGVSLTDAVNKLEALYYPSSSSDSRPLLSLVRTDSCALK
jgi:hypothetical protein